MMKRFKEIGKWTGFMLVACSLWFAGCAPDSSSEEGAMSGESASSIGIPAEFVPGDAESGTDGQIVFGDGGNAGQGVFDGHTIAIAGSSCTAEAEPTCWIKVTNLADSHYMANTRIYTTDSGDGIAVFDNADYDEAGANMHSNPPDGDPNTGYTALVEGGGFCVVEDGVYWVGYDTPYNDEGCKVRGMPMGDAKPYQMLAPDGGNITNEWDFGNHSGGNYPFMVQIDTEWWPENPHNDSRYDFQDRTTVYHMITDLSDGMTATYKDWYYIGSYKRSNVIAGWNADGANNSADSGIAFSETVTGPNGNSNAREYFALNIAVEYPDRIESRHMGDKSDFTNYEYYRKFAVTSTYDPSVVERVTASGKTRAGRGAGTNIVEGALGIGKVTGSSGIETYTGFVNPGGANTTYNDTAGYIKTYLTAHTTGFTWFDAGDSYSTVYGNHVVDYYGGNVPANVGHYGVAYVNMTPWTTTYPDSIVDSASAVYQEGVDDQPDMPIAMHMFKVKGEPGDVTWMRSNMYTADSQHELSWTNEDIEDGYLVGDDWMDYCWPMDGGTQGCIEDKPEAEYIVGHSREQSNENITHTGFAVADWGMYQSWNVHVIIE